ncbi:MAG: LarC family nickel insertion protein [Clostridiales Family XIII bacterium]|jgi:uncharacterized protein (DUF111 family)|nr:LarC family nickel insertion protein [Clostridiales Family XIII bacterium]
MKRILYFDCVAGISGDMTLGALLHLGADIDRLRAELDKLGVSGFSLVPGKAQMNGITGVSLDVRIDGARVEETREHAHEHGGADHSHDGNHAHDHGHAHTHGHTHDHGHGHTHEAPQTETPNAARAEEPERSFRDIRALIENSALNDNVKRLSIAIFTVIAEAEAAVHDIPTENVVFHEVGALDSIVDIVGAAVCVDMLGADEVLCSPVHDGSGFIRCRHGMIPVPVPAVMEMLKGSGIRIVGEDVPTEMVTPTGFGILKGLGARCTRLPELRVEGVGYGFGKRDTGRFNALRVILGELKN